MADGTPFDWTKFLTNVGIPAASAITGGVLAYKGAKGASAAASQSAKDALDFQKQMWMQGRSDLAPWINAGGTSLTKMLSLMGLKGPKGNQYAGPGAWQPGATNSPYSSPLLTQQWNAQNPSAWKTTGSRALAGAGAGATIGSVVPGIGTAVGAGIGAWYGGMSSLFGRGRREADNLVPEQNQVGDEIMRIQHAVDAAKQAGTLTKEDMQQAMDSVTALRQHFTEDASKFGRAGPGGVATFAKNFDPFMKDWQTQLDSGQGFAAGQDVGPDGQPAGADDPDFGGMNKVYGLQDFKDNPLYAGIDPTKYNAAFTGDQMEQFDPGYKFRLDNTMKAVQSSLAMKGLSRSGGAARSIAKNVGDQASSEFANANARWNGERAFSQGAYADAYSRFKGEQSDRWNRLAQLAGFGQNATNTEASLGNSFAGQGAGLMTDIGSANAAGISAGNNAIASAITRGGNMFGDYMNMKDLNKWMSQYKANQGSGEDGNPLNPEFSN